MQGLLVKKIIELAVYCGLPLVSLYHDFSENETINISFKNTSFLDSCADFFLTPTHYLFNARSVVVHSDHSVEIMQKYDYEENYLFKIVSSALILPASHTLGMILKGIALADANTFQARQIYKKFLVNQEIKSNLEAYEKLGISIIDESSMQIADCQNHQRRPDDLKNLKCEKQALEAIACALKEAKIPFWIDCGTCLGAYRYGGIIPWDFDIDLSILRPDFLNAFKALQKLDPKLYQVQDWSGRDRPKSYLKVYVKENHSLIDIYTFNIDEKEKTIQYLIGNENSIFLPEGWKIRERLYTKPSAFDQVFPLKLAKFDGLLLPVPNQTKEYLQLRYGENIGPVKIFNPDTNEYEKDLSHPYWQFQYAK